LYASRISSIRVLLSRRALGPAGWPTEHGLAELSLYYGAAP
jgi:hypothetical protein